MNPKWTSRDMPPQTGRVAIVTGANTGLGFETARVLAGKGAVVILCSRDEGKGRAAATRIMAETPSARCSAEHLDLADLSSVEDFAERFSAGHDRLDLLINNAGVMMPPRMVTRDGFELQFGTNHLGHFSLTGRLLTRLTATPVARIVSLSSHAHGAGRIDFDDLNWRMRRYRRFKAYADSKLANLLFAFEFDRRLRAAGHTTLSCAAHPGWADTNLQRYTWYFRLAGRLAQRPAMGALPQLYAATAEDVVGGRYFGPRALAGLFGHPRMARSSRLARDTELAARLWTVSEGLTGVRYTF